MNDLDLMRIRADTDFTYDTRGRMISSNEPCESARRPAPRLFVGGTPVGYVVRVGPTASDDLARDLAAIVERAPPSGDLRVPSAALTELRAMLARQAAITSEGGGPAYRFPEILPRWDETVQLTGANRELARETFPWLYDEYADWRPCFAIARDGAAVSVCYSARFGPVAAEAGVDTVAAFRGRGYAAAVTAAWGAAVRAAGRIPLYSTAWGNLPSQRVARRLGLIAFGADATWT